MDLKGRIAIYNAFIASNFRYCDVIYHFSSKESAYKLEKINKRALRVTLNDYQSDYSTLLEKIGSDTLFCQRVKSIAIECFKSQNGLSPKFIQNLFETSYHGYSTRGGIKYFQPIVNSDTHGINSFTYQGAKIWNCLPCEIKESKSLDDFKNKLKSWTGPQCSCASCVICKISRL